MASLSDEKYLNLTTFTKDGRPKPTAVWVVDAGQGRLGFTTSSGSWKVKRIQNTPKVTVQASDARGTPKPDSDVHPGTAEVVTGAEFERIKGLVRAKYGIQFTAIQIVAQLSKLVGKWRGGTDRAVIITLD